MNLFSNFTYSYHFKTRMVPPTLTDSESKVLQNAEFFTTKEAIDAKITDLFSFLKAEIERLNRESPKLPSEILANSGRFYRGEHMGPFPWRALDCPKLFSGNDMFTFRTLLVWGRHFSFHLILGGKWLQDWGPKIDFRILASERWQISRQTDLWDFTFSQDAYCLVSELSDSEWRALSSEKDWLKLTVLLPLSEFEAVAGRGSQLWANFLASLG